MARARVIIMPNWLFRLGQRGDEERSEEDAARAFHREHGHWPDEPPPAAP